MKKSVLKTRFDQLERIGLPLIIRARAENCINFRKHGDLGNWRQASHEILEQVQKHAPIFLKEVKTLFSEA
jgi:hypothetical protein